MTGMGGFLDIMKNAKQMMEKAKTVQADLAKRTAEGSAGAGMVSATVNGLGELIALRFEPGVVDPADPELLADLVIAAVADARTKVNALKSEAMREMTGGVDLSSLGIDLGGMM